MKTIDTNLYYAFKWGLGDPYEETEATLREAIASGEDFETTWMDCKKEIVGCKFTKADGQFLIEVSAGMDDLWESEDLIYDAMDEEIELPEHIIDGIRDEAIEFGLDDHSEASYLLPYNATYEEVMDATEQLQRIAMDKNDEMFETLKIIVKGYIEYMKKEEQA